MALLDVHLRHIIRLAAERESRNLIDDAHSIIECNLEAFGSELAPEILVCFAEVASDLRERDAAASRALDLYFRKRCEEDQFKVRALFIRCRCEARLGTETFKLKGMHLLQQIKYALSFLEEALAIATKKPFDEKYGFLVYNASLIYWEVSRTLNRPGWQQHLVQESISVLDKLKEVHVAGRGPGAAADKKGGKGDSAGPLIPVPASPAFTTWLIELTLSVAFGLDDKGMEVDAMKRADEAVQLLALLPDEDGKDELRMLAYNAKAYFGRRTAANVPKVREEVDKAVGSAVVGTSFLVSNRAIPKETCDEDLLKAWSAVDDKYDLRGKRDAFNPSIPAGEAAAAAKKAAMAEESAGVMLDLEAPQVVELAMLLRAACGAERFPLALAMISRLSKCKIPAGRGKILIDLSKAEVDVWHACTVRCENPATGMLLESRRQTERELDTRFHAVRLCEQCLMTAKRLGEMDLVEDSAVTLWNLAREFMCDQHRHRIHRSLLKASEILDDVQSVWLVQLRVQFHFECARCEIAQDLLTKAQSELKRVKMLDYTLSDNALDKETLDILSSDGTGKDPAPYLRRFDAVIDDQVHLLHWKLNSYEEPSDVADQVMLLLDQVRKEAGSRKEFVYNLLSQGYKKLDASLEELEAIFSEMPRDPFVPPPRTITSGNPLEPLPFQAPMTRKELQPGVAEVSLGGQPPQPIVDQRPKSPSEEVLARIKRSVMLMCKIACEAMKVGHHDFAVRACNRAIAAGTSNEVAFEAPIETEGAILLAETWYTKARCFAADLSKLDVIPGVDETIEPEVADGQEEAQPFEAFEVQLTPQEKEVANDKKRGLIRALFDGIRKCVEFKQWWLLANGIAHWWNLHLELVEISFEEPEILSRVLPEYRDGLREMQKFFAGADTRLPDSDFDSALVAKIILAHLDTACAVSDFSVLETDNVLALKRLSPDDRKEVMACLTKHCKKNDRALPDMARLKPERAEAAIAAAAAAAAAAGGKKDKNAPAVAPEPVDKTDFLGNEADLMLLVESVAYAKDPDAAKKCVEDAVALLSKWEPRQNDEQSVTLWVELWTRLGRQCLGETMKASVGPKAALACCIRGLGKVDAPIPKHASQARLRWRGACHALCGQVYSRLVDPSRQEKESVLKLQRMSVEQFERCCEYAAEVKDEDLAVFGARSLWNAALPLLHSADTRQRLISPLQAATRALAVVRYTSDPAFSVNMYAARYDCYADRSRWDAVHEMLGEAFSVVPSQDQRRLWALRMLALSRQGKNVVIAMSKMKETQAKAQADIWLVLATASARRSDQLDAYAKAIHILQEAKQADVIEVRLQFGDWLLRNGFGVADAQEQLAAAADLLLDVEVGSEEEDEEDEGVSIADPSLVSERKSTRSRRSSDAGRSAVRRSFSGSMSSRKSFAQRTQRSSVGSVRSKKKGKTATSASRTKKAGEDESMGDQLYSHHYELLVRLYATRSRLSSHGDFHGALLDAAHFASRFFAFSVELVNNATKELSVILAQEAAAATKPGSAGLQQGAGRQRAADADAAPAAPFTLPLRLVDWADMTTWPWRSSNAFKDIIVQAEQRGIIDGDALTWAGKPEAFARPSLTFHALTQLVEDLAEHGHHLLAFPILALQAELADAFQGVVRDSVNLLVRMRLARLAADCGLQAQAAAATEAWEGLVEPLLQSFGSFKEELDKVASQRSGRGLAGTLDPDRVKTASGRTICAAWTSEDLHAYQVWVALSKECVLNGELCLACELSNAALEHAQKYGDRRAIRDLCVTKASIAQMEGRYAEVVRSCQRVSAADLQQTAQMALLLAGAYQAKNEFAQADNLLQDACDALQNSPHAALVGGGQAGAPRRLVAYSLAECTLRCTRLMLELAQLSVSAPSNAWTKSLSSCLSQMATICAELHGASLFKQHMSMCVDFANSAMPLLEAKLHELTGDASLHVDKGGALSFEYLERQGQQLCSLLVEARASRSMAVQSVVPVEGMEANTATPVEVLSLKLEVCMARTMATCRALRASADAHRSRQQAKPSQSQPNDLSFFGQVPAHPGVGGPDDIEERPLSSQGQINKYLDESALEVDQKDRIASRARLLEEAEESAALVSGAYATVRALFSSAGGVEGSAAESTGEKVPLPPYMIEAQVELGRLQVELAMQETPDDVLWEAFDERDRFEIHAMECAERSSNVFKNTNMDEVFRMPEGSDDNDEPAAAVAAEASGIATGGSAEADANADVALDEAGKETLCEGLRAALVAHHFVAAKRALQCLALEAYGARCPEATFEFLVWLQSVDVCIRAEETLMEVLPETHHEVVQLRVLRQLDANRTVPQSLKVYQTTLNRLRRESPFFQRLDLIDLPPIADLMLSYVPPLTLVVTLQLHGGHLYVGAARSPAADGDRTLRLGQLRHKVLRLAVSEAEVGACVSRIQELNQQLEKELALADGLDPNIEQQYEEVLSEIQRVLAEPIARELAAHFWPLGVGFKHPSNPQQLVILPGSALWSLPLERMTPLLNLFGPRSHGAVSRDFSLHVAAQRVRRVVEADGKPVQLRVPAVKADNAVLLTDAFNEDHLGKNDAPGSETAGLMHKRLVEAKIVSNDKLSFPRLQEAPFDASSKDIKAMLFACNAFYSLTFGRFLHAIDSASFAAMDMSRVSLLAIFGRCVNDKAFRRQTKANSLKTARALVAENDYGFPLMAAFRGVQCTVVSAAPLPTCLAMRCLDIFLRSMKGGKTVGEAMEDALAQPCPDPDSRYCRPPQGGFVVPNSDKGSKAASPTPAGDGVDLLPFHTKAALLVVGAPWLSEDGSAPGGKKR